MKYFVNKLFDIYAVIFARPIFIYWHKFLHHLSLRGLGILNCREGYLKGDEFDWFKKHLKKQKNPLIVDVGANKGNYTLNILQIKPTSKIISIEPHPITFERLKEKVLSKNVTFYNYAIGGKKGKLKLYDYSQNDGSSHASLYHDVISDLHRGKVTSHAVELEKLEGCLSLQLQY